MKKTVIMIVCAGLVAAAVTARADSGWIDSFFDVTFEGDTNQWNSLNEAASSGNGWVAPADSPWWAFHETPSSGAESGPWYQYPQLTTVTDPAGNTENDPMWWNQWWYDHPYDPLRHKLIDLTFDYSLTNLDAGDGYVIVTINYSTPEWSAVDPTGSGTEGLDPRAMPPPADLGPSGEPWLGRVTLDQIVLAPGNRSGTYESGIVDLREYEIFYNPEWVSVDVRGYNFTLDGTYGPAGDQGQLLHACVPEPASLMLLALSGLVLLRRRRA